MRSIKKNNSFSRCRAAKLKNVEYGMVDGYTFDGAPAADRTLQEQMAPCRYTDLQWGRQLIQKAVQKVAAQVREDLLQKPWGGPRYQPEGKGFADVFAPF